MIYKLALQGIIAGVALLSFTAVASASQMDRNITVSDSNGDTSHTIPFEDKSYVNPAAAYSLKMGYLYELRTDEEGNQYGVTMFPDGSEADSWDFLKGKVAESYSYCRKNGFDTETEYVDNGSYSTECAVCVSRDEGLREATRIPMLELMEQNGEPLVEGELYSSKTSTITEEADSTVKTSGLRGNGLPASFDWRDLDGKTYIGPVRNQGSCGSCYAFGAAASAEGTYNWAVGNYDANCADFSESFIAWCLGAYGPYSAHFSGCDGADYSYSELTAISTEGVCDDSDFPYTQSDPGSCTHWADPRTKFASWHRIACSDVDAIKTAMMTYGVLDAAVYADTAFQSYDGGVYFDSNTVCDGDPCYNTVTNHAISLVGWDDNPPEGGGGVWILRNSWGSSWGEDGYMRIRYTSAAVACAACYLEWPAESTISCDSDNIEVNSFAPGEDVYANGSGLAANTDYRIWIQDSLVGEGETLVSGEDPSGAQEDITTNSAGGFDAALIWEIDPEATVTNHEYVIVVDKLDDGDDTGKFNDASDGIDSLNTTGLIAPVPELPTIISISLGLAVLVTFMWIKRVKNSATYS